MTDRYANHRPNEGTKIVRTYRLEPDTVRRIDALADELRTYQSPLIESLLRYALAEVDAGNIRLGRWPVKYEVYVE